MFNADEGLIHFTFANEDIYIKNSLLLLDRQGNLYYELKKKYYNTVIFVDLEENNYRITCGDGAAKQLYERYREKGMFEKVKAWASGTNDFVEEHKSTVYAIPREQKETMLGTLDRMMSNSRETAFVFSIDAMASFQGIASAQKILNKQKTENCGNRNLLLIVSDTQLNVSFDKLTNPDGIFQTEAFPKIREICQNYTNPRLYECMKKKMPERITYLNEMKWDELNNLVIWSVIKLGNKLSERMNRLEDYTDFIFLLVHSAKFSNQMRKKYSMLNEIFTANDTRLFSVLQKNLSTNAAYEQMDTAIEAIRGNNKVTSLFDLVHVDDRGDEYQIYLYQSNPTLKMLNALTVNNENRKVDTKTRDIITDINQKLNAIRKELAKPHVISDKRNHEELQQYINYYVDCIQTADGLRDYETMKLGVEALNYAICKCEQEMLNGYQADEQPAGESGGKSVEKNAQSSKQILCLDAYKTALEFQSSIGDQNRKVRTYLLNLRDLTEQAEELQKEIKDIERESPNIAQRAKNLQDHSALVEDYRSLVAESVVLEEDKKAISYNMKLIKMNLVEQKKSVAALRSEINSIEDSIYTMTHWQFDSSHEFMYDMGEKIAKLRAANNNYFERLHQRNDAHHLQFDAEQALQDDNLDINLEMDDDIFIDDELDLQEN